VFFTRAVLPAVQAILRISQIGLCNMHRKEVAQAKVRVSAEIPLNLMDAPAPI
jgi:hypothetical protein